MKTGNIEQSRTNDCNKKSSLSHKNKSQNILYDDINAHLLVLCLPLLCRSLKSSCTRLKK